MPGYTGGHLRHASSFLIRISTGPPTLSPLGPYTQPNALCSVGLLNTETFNAVAMWKYLTLCLSVEMFGVLMTRFTSTVAFYMSSFQWPPPPETLLQATLTIKIITKHKSIFIVKGLETPRVKLFQRLLIVPLNQSCSVKDQLSLGVFSLDPLPATGAETDSQRSPP